MRAMAGGDSAQAGLEGAAVKRSSGVTVIAVLSLLGSLVVLLIGALVAALPFLSSKFGDENSAFPPGVFKLMMGAVALVYILLAAWGIATSVGLFRLRNWARISIIVFAVCLISMGGFSALTFLVMPFPAGPNQQVDAHIVSGVRVVMLSFAAGLLGIGAWWLVYFTRSKVKQQFVPVQALIPGATAGAPGVPFSAPSYGSTVPDRPLSFTVIAWLLLVGAVFLPINIVMRYPAMIFTKVVTGWPAAVYYLALAAVHLYVGIGLLRLQLRARMVAIAYYGFMFVNMGVFYLAPGGSDRMLDLMRKSVRFPWVQAEAWQRQMAQFNTTSFLVLGAVAGLVGMLVPLYFLVTRKQAFENAAAAASSHPIATPS